MTYTPNAELKAALSALPLLARIRTRWTLRKRLRALSETDKRIDALFRTYDCGAALIDTMTAGRLSRLEILKGIQADRVREITEPLLNQTGKAERAV